MNFVLFENENGKENFVWESELEKLPNDTIAFTYYQQDNVDENGILQNHEYRIGVPVKFIIGDIKNIKLDNIGICFDIGHCHLFFNDKFLIFVS